MKIVFFGTPNYVIPILDALHKSFKIKGEKSPIVAVVTQTPKPAGRKNILEYSEVDKWAHKHSVPKFYSSKEFLESKIEAGVGVLASFGQIIPTSALDCFRHGIVNIHPSLLPEFRGASPVQATIATGQKITGSTFIKLDEKLDHGPILGQFKEEVKNTDTTESLRNRLFNLSAEALPKLLEAYVSEKIKPKAQDHKKASFTRQVKKSDGFIDFEVIRALIAHPPVQGSTLHGKWEISFIKNYSLDPTPYTLNCFIRAMHPWPGVWTNVKILRNKDTKILRLKILKAHLETISNDSQEANKTGTKLVLDEVQLEGKNPVSWKQFTEAYDPPLF